MIEQLAGFEDQAHAQSSFQSGLVENRHWLAEEMVLSAKRRHQAAGRREQIAFARTLQTADHPEIASCNGPIHFLDNQQSLIAHRTDIDLVHLNDGPCGRCVPIRRKYW